jgi:uncharacterized protein with HEPN domain
MTYVTIEIVGETREELLEKLRTWAEILNFERERQIRDLDEMMGKKFPSI